MTKGGLALRCAVCALALLCVSCAPAWVPVVGKSPEVQADSVRSIKTIRLRRIAVMPPIEAPAPGSTVAEGATDSLTAELQAKMALEAGWQLIPESDVVDAMQKLPPTNAADLQQNAIELGHKTGADGVLYGEIETYKERVGSDYAAASPAAVAFTLHLVDLKSGQVIWNARFHKSQKALNENTLTSSPSCRTPAAGSGLTRLRSRASTRRWKICTASSICSRKVRRSRSRSTKASTTIRSDGLIIAKAQVDRSGRLRWTGLPTGQA